MPSIRYMNQSAPFWDFVANLEDRGTSHPFFAFNNNDNRGASEATEGTPFGWGGPWGWQHHRGHSHHRGRPGPPHGEGHHQSGESYPPGPPPPDAPREPGEHHPSGAPQDPSQGPPPPEGHAPHGHSGSPPRHRGCGGRRGGFGRRGRGGFPMGGPFNFAALGELFQSQFGQEDENEAATRDVASQDYKPDVDVFDTENSFVVHVSLPGAKKEDVGVNWDSEKSELSVAGVIYRPGDEDFLKTLALDERKTGAFERKVRLGSRANPAQIEVDSISAKLEDGVLKIDVPKLDRDYVEVKKVDIE